MEQNQNKTNAQSQVQNPPKTQKYQKSLFVTDPTKKSKMVTSTIVVSTQLPTVVFGTMNTPISITSDSIVMEVLMINTAFINLVPAMMKPLDYIMTKRSSSPAMN